MTYRITHDGEHTRLFVGDTSISEKGLVFITTGCYVSTSGGNFLPVSVRIEEFEKVAPFEFKIRVIPGAISFAAVGFAVVGYVCFVLLLLACFPSIDLYTFCHHPFSDNV